MSVNDSEINKKSIAVELYQGCDKKIKYRKVNTKIEMPRLSSRTAVFLRIKYALKSRIELCISCASCKLFQLGPNALKKSAGIKNEPGPTGVLKSKKGI